MLFLLIAITAPFVIAGTVTIVPPTVVYDGRLAEKAVIFLPVSSTV